MLHLVQHYFALLGDDVFRLAPEGGENLEVVILLSHTHFVHNTARQHGFGEPEQVVLVDCDVDDLVTALFRRYLFEPLDLQLSVLFLCIPDAISVDYK